MAIIRRRSKRSVETIEQIRAAYQHCLELASEAQKNGDHVLCESHRQHAEYYLHRINEMKARLNHSTSHSPSGDYSPSAREEINQEMSIPHNIDPQKFHNKQHHTRRTPIGYRRGNRKFTVYYPETQGDDETKG